MYDLEKALGIDIPQAEDIFRQPLFKGEYIAPTPKQVAKVLRNLTIDGRVNWSPILNQEEIR